MWSSPQRPQEEYRCATNCSVELTFQDWVCDILFTVSFQEEKIYCHNV